MVLWFLTVATRTVAMLLRLGGYGGTALPGIWVERYAPKLISLYAARYQTIILVTGTNGKTTVQLALRQILQHAGRTVVNNASGSNLLRGVATTLLTAGPAIPGTILICEVEEATMPTLTRLLTPTLIIITNLYRDQLDAYGELDKTAEYIKKSCHNNPKATLVVNGDDPTITRIVSELPHTKHVYSLGSYAQAFSYEGHTANTQSADIVVQSTQLTANLSTNTVVHEHAGVHTIHFRPPGVYNVYNALAAYTSSRVLGIDSSTILDGLAHVEAPFGRGEQVSFTHDGKKSTVQIFLVKNPAGYTQVWEMLSQQKDPFNLILGLNDNVADGKDVSWIWDIDLKSMQHADTIHHIYFTGTRALDMALRFKYSSVSTTSQDVRQDISQCLDEAIEKLPEGRICFALVTYTAMNTLRDGLGRYTTISPYSI